MYECKHINYKNQMNCKEEHKSHKQMVPEVTKPDWTRSRTKDYYETNF